MFSRRHLAGLLAAICFAAAGLLRADETIIFSKPADLPTEKANSFMEQMPHKLSDVHNAPSPIFGHGDVDFDRLPGAQLTPQMTPQQMQTLKKQLDEKKNWTLLTPEEILGLPTAEKIMGLPEREFEGQLSVEERYVRRQERQRSSAATNSLAALAGPEENPFGLNRDRREKASQNSMTETDDRAGYLNRSMSAAKLQARENAARNSGVFWKSAFDTRPQTIAQPNFDQQAMTEHYRALMEQASPEKPLTSPDISRPAAPVHDPNIQAMPDYNPIGNAARPLQNAIGRPTGIMPLPTVTGARPQQAIPEKRKPLVERPPWLKDDDQPPTTPPMRKF